MLVAHYSVTQQTMQMVIKLTVSIQFGEIPMLSTHHRKDMLSFVKKKNYENWFYIIHIFCVTKSTINFIPGTQITLSCDHVIN